MMAREGTALLLVNGSAVAMSSHDNDNQQQQPQPSQSSEQIIITVNDNCPLSADSTHSLVPRPSLQLHDNAQKGKLSHDLTVTQQLRVDAAIVMVMKKSKFLAFDDLTKQLLTVLDFVPDVGEVKRFCDSV